MEDLAVEVRGENGAHYKAFVIDVHDNDISVAFENDWQPPNKFPFQRIRLPSTPCKDGEKPEITEGQEVEVGLLPGPPPPPPSFNAECIVRPDRSSLLKCASIMEKRRLRTAFDRTRVLADRARIPVEPQRSTCVQSVSCTSLGWGT
ncbi:unnamed protein product [Ixodes persulcatus]